MILDTKSVSLDKSIGSALTQDTNRVVLEAGKKICCEIISVEGSEVLLKLGSAVIKARNAGSEQLYSGMIADFEVLKSDKSLIEIRPVALSALSSEESNNSYLQKLASDMGVVETTDNLALLSKMMKLNHPISKANFDNLKLLMLQMNKIGETLQREVSAEFQNLNSPNQPFNAEEVLNSLVYSPKEIISKRGLLNDILNLLNSDMGKFENNISPKNIEIAGEANIPILDEESGYEPKNPGSDSKTPARSSSQEQPVSVSKEELLKLKAVLENYRDIALNKDEALGSSVFLNKHNIKQDVLNTLILNSILKGGLGISEAVFELNDEVLGKMRPELKAAVEMFKSVLVKQGDLEKLDGETLEKMVKIYDNLLTKMEEGSRKSTGLKEFFLLERNSAFSKDLQPMLQSVVLPMISYGELRDLELYVKRDAASKASDASNNDKLVYLSLKTENMDRVKVKIDYKPKSIRLSFFTAANSVEAHFKACIYKLQRVLSMLSDKEITVSVNTEVKDLGLVDFELMSAKSHSKIDVRI